MKRENLRHEQDPETGRIMDVWDAYDPEIDDIVRISSKCEKEECELQDTTVASTAVTKVAGSAPKVHSGQVQRMDTKANWPATTLRGEPIATSIVNVDWFCEQAGIQAKFNEFDQRTYVLLDEIQCELDDSILREVMFRMHSAMCHVSMSTVDDALKRMGAKNKFHPVREYLAGIKWDRKKRLKTLLPHYLNAEDTPLNQAIGTAWMIAAGCKFDAILTLQSDQGTGKSTFFRVLASDAWINDSVDIGASAKEVIENTAGSSILEHAELSKLNNREVEEVKKFATIREDRARTAWGRIASRVPRQFVCGASVNRATFLKDDTGNRRFWVAAVGRTREPELAADRDQLWAEAAYLEAKGAAINIPEELWPAAARVADKHMKEDPVADEVVAVLSELPETDAIVLARDLARAIGVEDVTKSGGQVAQSIAAGARRAGWTGDCGRIPGVKSNGSVRHYAAPMTGAAVRVYLFEKSRGVFSLFHNGRFVKQQRGTPEAEL